MPVAVIRSEVQESLSRRRLSRLQDANRRSDRRAERARRLAELSTPVEQKQAPPPAQPAPAQPEPIPFPFETIPSDSMDFGTPEASLCGICGRPEEGNWDGDELQEVIMCSECARAGWNYDERIDCYVRLGLTPYLKHKLSH